MASGVKKSKGSANRPPDGDTLTIIDKREYQRIQAEHEAHANSRKEQIQKDADEIRNRVCKDGRYSIGEAVILLLAATGEYFRVGRATWDGALRCYEPGSVKPKDVTGNNRKKWTDYSDTDEVHWEDLNKWLAENFPLLEYKFPDPRKPDGLETEAAPVGAAGAFVAQPKQLLQERRILELLKAQGYDPLNLPLRRAGKSGPKAEIKKLALQEPALFTIKTFDTAWQRLRGADEVAGAE